LARGLLSGSRTKGQSKVEGETLRSKGDAFAQTLYASTVDNDFAIIDRVLEIAKKKEVSAAQISLAWLLNKPQVVAPIIGCSKMQQLEESVAALNVKLTVEEMKYLEELYKPHVISGHS